MRLFPGLAGLMLITTTALAQPAPDTGGPGPGYDPGQQGAPMQAPPGDGQMQGPEGGAAQGPQGGPMQGGGGPMQRPHMTLSQRFDMANTTHDGRLTREQAEGRMHVIAHNFDRIDTDHKGYVTMQDIRAWHRAMHQARASQQPPPPPPQ